MGGGEYARGKAHGGQRGRHSYPHRANLHNGRISTREGEYGVIEIKGITKEETAYDKEMTISYEGQEYSIILHWDKWDGYEIFFNDIDTPDWAIDWEENNNNESLDYLLDGLTEQILEASNELR
jgi:hypothetical protein